MFTRVFAGFGHLLRPTVIGLLIFSVVQVCWWMWDQADYAENVEADLVSLYSQDLAAARHLAVLGVSTSDVTRLFPHIAADVDGSLVISAGARTALENDRRRHVVQYVWESGFFLCVLAACIGILWRGLHEEREVRQQQSNFLALVSHQFKTPLASLRLSVETMIKRQPPPDYARQLAQRMLDDLSRLESMVTKILDSARLNRGHVAFNNTRVDLAAAVEHVVTRLAESARKNNVTIEMRIPQDAAIHADPMAVENVIRNLLENAVTATARTGGTITIAAKPGMSEVDIAVMDTGIGFSEDDGAKLFEKFQRLENGQPPADVSTGTGLGLFIVRRIMHFQGGYVTAVSPGLGKGATFTVTWPKAVDDAESMAA
jgi:signal transduction histidine kinase